MKVILWMAISLNGMIARANNEEDFISHDSWLEWLKWIRKSGCLVWGRKTHQIVKTWGKQYLDDIKGIKIIIVSTNPDYDVGDGITLAQSPEESLKILEKEGYDEVIVTGGSGINSSFAKAGLLDEVVFNVEPVVVGKGIAVFNPQEFDLKLELRNIVKLSDNLVQFHYIVQK